MCNKYDALVLLSQDPRIPVEQLKSLTGCIDEEILTIVSDTGGRHYRLLGFVPPSELVLGLSVQKFYKLLEIAGLAEITYEEEVRAVGCIPKGKAVDLSINIPCYGKDWHAWQPDILDLL